ncbi:MAG: SPOR domain-containing protein, partial [Pseudomonadota bacterium]
PEPVAPAAPAPATARYVQVGTFGVRDNAEALVQLLRREGFDAVMRDTILNGREFSRVLVGPVVDPAILSRTLGDLRSRGFRDALVVRS